jgi:hypothetical protein
MIKQSELDIWNKGLNPFANKSFKEWDDFSAGNEPYAKDCSDLIDAVHSKALHREKVLITKEHLDALCEGTYLQAYKDAMTFVVNRQNNAEGK